MDGCYLALALCAALTDRRAGRHLPLERSFQEATVDHVSMGAEKVHVLRMNFNNTPSPPPPTPPPTPPTHEVNPEPGRADGASRENPGKP